MKRILAAGLSLAVTVFFTGCGSLAGSMEVDSKRILDEAESQVTVADSDVEVKISWDPEDGKKNPEDFFQQNMAEKFQNLGGKEAFRIAQGHSREPEDIEEFSVAGMRGESTFVYGYTTRAEGGEKPRDVVHCGAWYDYETGDLHVFHENRFQREGEDEKEQGGAGPSQDGEAFFIQQCIMEDGSAGDIFVYDNGQGFLYDSDGTIKFRAEVEAFIRRQYQDAFSVAVAHAMVDEKDRIYLDLSIELEELEVPEENSGETEEESQEAEGEEKDSEETEEEIRKMEEEEAAKIRNVVMVYEVHQIAGDIYQKNGAFEAQKQAWINMAEGMEFLEEDKPDNGEDWARAREKIPDEWEGAILKNLRTMGEYENTPVYVWKGDALFQKENGVVGMVPQPEAYTPAKEWTGNQRLDKHFILVNGSYSQLYGEIGDFQNMVREEFSRRFTLASYHTESDEEGNPVEVKSTRGLRQTARRTTGSRQSQLKNCYVETYRVLDPEKAKELVDSPGWERYCVGADGTVYQISPEDGESLDEAGMKLEEDEQAGILKDGDQQYLLAYDTEQMRLLSDGREENALESAVISYRDLAGNYQEGTGAYNQQFQEMNEDSLPGGMNGYGNMTISGDQMLYAKLTADSQVVEALKEYPEAGEIWSCLGSGSEGLLLTMQGSGLVFYDVKEKKSLVVAEGSWYRSWRQGSRYLSVGFPGNASYETKDMVFARVYEYDLNTLCSQSMEELLAKLQAEKRKKQEEEASRAAADATRDETVVEDMMDQWNRKQEEKENQPETSETPEAGES